MISLPIPSHLPKGTPATLVYRFIAAFLSPTVFTPDHWECRNGYFDTADFGSGVVNDFELFPGARERLRVTLPGDSLEEPACRFWFLRQEDEPLLCLETTGRAWSRDGAEHDLVSLHKKNRSIWVTVTTAAGGLLA